MRQAWTIASVKLRQAVQQGALQVGRSRRLSSIVIISCFATPPNSYLSRSICCLHCTCTCALSCTACHASPAVVFRLSTLGVSIPPCIHAACCAGSLPRRSRRLLLRPLLTAGVPPIGVYGFIFRSVTFATSAVSCRELHFSSQIRTVGRARAVHHPD